MALITVISTNELTFIFMMTRTLDLIFVDIVGIRVQHISPCSLSMRRPAEVYFRRTLEDDEHGVALNIMGNTCFCCFC